MKWFLISLVLFFSQVAFSETTRSETTRSETTRVTGTWQIHSTFYDGVAQPIRQPKQVKIFTEERFFYTYYDPSLGTAEPVLAVGHGTYELERETLSETIENHTNAALIGETFSVSIKFSEDGDAFEQEVDLGKYVLIERWVRVE